MRRQWSIVIPALFALVLLTGTARAGLWPVLDSHWKLDETDTASTLVHDARGGVPGTRMGDVSIGVSGLDGTAYSFPGQDSAYVDFNRADWIPQTGPFKLDMWIKTAVSTGRTQYLLSSYQGTDPGRTLMYMDSSGRIRLQIGGGSGFLLNTPSGTNFADDEWHRITLSREKVDPATDILRLYVDEIERDWKVASPSLIIGGGNNHDWQLSGSINVSSRHFNGLVDDIRVYVPEPSSMALLLVAAGLLLLRRRGR